MHFEMFATSALVGLIAGRLATSPTKDGEYGLVAEMILEARLPACAGLRNVRARTVANWLRTFTTPTMALPPLRASWEPLWAATPAFSGPCRSRGAPSPPRRWTGPSSAYRSRTAWTCRE